MFPYWLIITLYSGRSKRSVCSPLEAYLGSNCHVPSCLFQLMMTPMMTGGTWGLKRDRSPDGNTLHEAPMLGPLIVKSGQMLDATVIPHE